MIFSKKNGTLNISTGEKQIYDFIKTLGFKPTKYIIGNNHESKRFEIDIYIPELNIGIEYNGTYYHSSEGPNGKIFLRIIIINQSMPVN